MGGTGLSLSEYQGEGGGQHADKLIFNENQCGARLSSPLPRTIKIKRKLQKALVGINGGDDQQLMLIKIK